MTVLQFSIKCGKCGEILDIEQNGTGSDWVAVVDPCPQCERQLRAELRADILSEIKNKVSSIE